MPHSVTYDSRSFLIRGERALLISGEIHYARSPRQHWPVLLDRSREFGLNCVATYIFWNFHEPCRDLYEFSGEHDLGHFLQLCAARGLHVILRAGPYCCAEWNYGGYPPWLRDEPGITIRTFNEPYLRRVEKYFEHLAAEVRPHLATRGGPVILVQVENEYGNVAKRYGADGQRYLAWMAELARRVGFDVPIIMCEGGSPDAVETVNGFSNPATRIEEFRRQHPDRPLLWTELWPAWYDTWGYQRHRRDARNIAFHVLDFVRHGGSGWNYYMWHGGTNFGRNAMYLQTTSYDFDAPLDEFGRPSSKGAYLKNLHRVLHEHAGLLLEGERKTDGARTVWSHNGRVLALELDAEKRTARLLDGAGNVLFDTAAGHAFPRRAWKTLPAFRVWQSWPEPLPAQREDEAVRSRQPIEQVSLTKDESDYCWYSTELIAKKAGQQTIEITYGADLFRVFLDGKLVGASQPPFHELRGPTTPTPRELANEFELPDVRYRQRFNFPAGAGRHRLDILAASLGLIKGDWMISGPMNEERKGIWRPVLHNGRALRNWEMRPRLAGEQAGVIPWRSSSRGRPCTWHTATFRLSRRMLNGRADFRLDATGLWKGMLFVNGHALGRHWLIEANGFGLGEDWLRSEQHALFADPGGQPTQRHYHVPWCWLKEENRLVLFEESACSPKSLRLQVRHS